MRFKNINMYVSREKREKLLKVIVIKKFDVYDARYVSMDTNCFGLIIRN